MHPTSSKDTFVTARLGHRAEMQAPADRTARGRTGRGTGGSGRCHFDQGSELHSARGGSVGYNACGSGSERTVLLTQGMATQRWYGGLVDKDQCLRWGDGIDCACVPDAIPIVHGAHSWCFSGHLASVEQCRILGAGGLLSGEAMQRSGSVRVPWFLNSRSP